MIKRKGFNLKYKRFPRGLISTLAKEFGIKEDQRNQFIGRISGSRKVSPKNAEILSEKFLTIGIKIPIRYWYGKNRGTLRKLIKDWHKTHVLLYTRVNSRPPY